MMRALTDVDGNAFYAAGQMLVVLTDEPEPTPPAVVVAPLGKYVPLGGRLVRTIVRKHR